MLSGSTVRLAPGTADGKRTKDESEMAASRPKRTVTASERVLLARCIVEYMAAGLIGDSNTVEGEVWAKELALGGCEWQRQGRRRGEEVRDGPWCSSRRPSAQRPLSSSISPFTLRPEFTRLLKSHESEY